MTLTPRPDDDRAVTPVVGIVLMVAVAVILAALVSIHAFGLLGTADDVGPNVQVRFNYSTSAAPDVQDSWGRKNTSDTYDGLLTFTMEGGTNVPPERLTLTGATGLTNGSFSGNNALGDKEFYESGDTLRVWVAADDTVRLVWRDPGGEKSAAVAIWDSGE
jgi:flagellin-like protein